MDILSDMLRIFRKLSGSRGASSDRVGQIDPQAGHDDLTVLLPDMEQQRDALEALRNRMDIVEASCDPSDTVDAIDALHRRVDAIEVTQDRVDAVDELDSRIAAAAREIERLNQKNAVLVKLATYMSDGPAGQGKSGPLVTVILPTFNRQHCITDAIESVIRQSYQNWELMIIDDGSTDDTAARIAPYLSDTRIRFIPQERSGHAAARNRGLEASRGSLIAHLDSDCVFYPGFLNAMVGEFRKDPALDFAYGALTFEENDPFARDILFEPFDRARLLAGNYIDMNVIVYRKELFERLGGPDLNLSRLSDWDVALRYTAEKPGRAVPIVAAQYRIRDENRVSATMLMSPNHFQVVRKWYPGAVRLPRVLYVAGGLPESFKACVETEIHCMQRWGVHVELWHDVDQTWRLASPSKIHRGTLEEAIALSKVDIIHICRPDPTGLRLQVCLSSGLPVTVNLRGFDVSASMLGEILGRDGVGRVFGFPHQLKLLNSGDARMHAVNPAFDASTIKPFAEKDRTLVVSAVDGLTDENLSFFSGLARLLPDHHFTLIDRGSDRTADRDASIGRMDSRVKVLLGPSNEAIFDSISKAGIYLHASGSGLPSPTFGELGSVIDAMATGSYILSADCPELREYVGEAGEPYLTLDQAAELIARTSRWSADEWRKVWVASVERAFQHYPDELAFRTILDDWIALIGSHPVSAEVIV